jgi:DeoR/GlpR family transcriptional regulator of sugar metabolism
MRRSESAPNARPERPSLRGSDCARAPDISSAVALSASREPYAEELRDRLDRIGQVTAELVNQGDVVLLDSGSTVAEVAAQMPGSLRAPNAVTVVSHSLPVIEEVGSWQQPHLICLGGCSFPTTGPRSGR